jgi:hypothetical protein
MTMTIQTNMTDRRALVRLISERLRLEARYQGPPTFAYAIGPVVVGRDGAVTCDDDGVPADLKTCLADLGYTAPESETTGTPTHAPEAAAREHENESAAPDTLTITVPAEGMTGGQARNLIHMLHGYQQLLNRITRHNAFAVSEAVMPRLAEGSPADAEGFTALTRDFRASGDLAGVDFKDRQISLTFPLDTSPEKNRAYADLAAAMVKAARTAKRIDPRARRSENEKYELRSWLVRLGLGGPDFRATRAALLKGLNGHAAFPSEKAARKHSEKYAELRRMAREAKGDAAV